MLSHVFVAVDKTSSSFSAHGKIGNFIIIITITPLYCLIARVDPLQLCRWTLLPKTRVSEDSIILRSFILTQYLRVTDRQTDRDAVAKTTFSIAALCENDRVRFVCAAFLMMMMMMMVKLPLLACTEKQQLGRMWHSAWVWRTNRRTDRQYGHSIYRDCTQRIVQ